MTICKVQILCLLILAMPGELLALRQCEVMAAETEAGLAQYVHDQFRFPPETQIEVAFSEVVSDTCYRKVHFRRAIATDPSDTIMSLFLSPDQQFLTRELFDTNENPWELRQREARDLESALENGKFPTKGLPDAPVIVTIFSDFQCPYCRQQAIIFSQFTDPDIRIIFRNLPLSSHSWARPAAEMTTCLYQQSNEAFWQVHDSLFLAQQSLSSIEYLIAFLERALSTTAGVDMSEYKECVSKKEMSEHVDRDIAFAVENGITSTPTLFVNGIRVEGVTSIEGMRKILESTSQNQTIGQP